MPQIQYVQKRFSQASLGTIHEARGICEQYAAQGFTLTLRQLYYQFVARGLIANKDTEYKRLGGIISDARIAGLLDWTYLEDRTRNLRARPNWYDPESIIQAAAQSYHVSYWARQPYYVEVWIEKDALSGVIEPVCTRNDVPFFSCRGYTSQSEIWGAGRRLRSQLIKGKSVLVIHLGDHDPSGIDMTRDIHDRVQLFAEAPVEIRRIALNMDQVQQYNPPPNPAKITDSRATAYIREYGDESWELDALEPTVIDQLIQDVIDEVRDDDEWQATLAREERQRTQLTRTYEHWDGVIEYLRDQTGEDY